MAGIIAVYSLVIAVLIAGDMSPPPEHHIGLFEYGISIAQLLLVKHY